MILESLEVFGRVYGELEVEILVKLKKKTCSLDFNRIIRADNRRSDSLKLDFTMSSCQYKEYQLVVTI